MRCAIEVTSMSRSPGRNLLQNFREDLVLQPRGPPDQCDFFVALDRLDGVDVRGDIDE